MRGVARGIMRGAQTPRHIFGVGDYTAFGADFDGTNDGMARGADLTGSADVKVGLFSSWIRVDGGDNTFRAILGNTDLGIEILFRSINRLQIVCENVSGTRILDIITSGVFLAGSAWIHILASWDLGTGGRAHIFIDDVNDSGSPEVTNEAIDYTKADWKIGQRVGNLRWHGCFSEMYFALEWLDITVEANRRKFTSADGKPISLGADGSLPTGTAPLIYFNNPFGTFETNKGTGGNFTVTGALSECSTSPSD